MREWEWEGMGINILLREGVGMFLCTTIGMGWKWEYGHDNRREWDRKSRFRTSLVTRDSNMGRASSATSKLVITCHVVGERSFFFVNLSRQKIC